MSETSATPTPPADEATTPVPAARGMAGGLDPEREVVMVPTPPGARRLGLGILLAALAPLAGFLFGSMAGTGDPEASFSPMFLFLFAGIVLGGVGLVIAGIGGLRLYRHLSARTSDPSDPAS